MCVREWIRVWVPLCGGMYVCTCVGVDSFVCVRVCVCAFIGACVSA